MPSGNKDVELPLHEQCWLRDRLELEAPWTHEGEIVVDPAAQAIAHGRADCIAKARADYRPSDRGGADLVVELTDVQAAEQPAAAGEGASAKLRRGPHYMRSAGKPKFRLAARATGYRGSSGVPATYAR